MTKEKELKLSENDGTGRYFCYYGNGEQGYIEYWKKWKKWVWNQNEGIIMSKSCLLEVIRVIDKLAGDALK